MKRLTICLIVLIVAGGVMMLPATSAQSEMTCDDLAPAGVPPALFVGMGDAYFAQGDHRWLVLVFFDLW